MIATAEKARKWWWCPWAREGTRVAIDPEGEHGRQVYCRQLFAVALVLRFNSDSDGKPVGYCGLAGRPKRSSVC